MNILRRHRQSLGAEVAAHGRRIHDLTALVDDVIDAMTSSRVVVGADIAGISGPIHGQIWAPSAWSCRDPGRGLTKAQAQQIMREHIDCTADPAQCRIKTAAKKLLVDTGALVRDSHRPSELIKTSW